MKCFCCGNKCDSTYKVKDYIKSTFTNYEIVKSPDSNFICSECVWSLETNTATIKMIDGEIRSNSTVRLYSWIILENKKIAATKKHINKLREIILNPPEPPFKIVLSESGQKHLLFRSSWALTRNNFPVQLEEETIIVNIEELKKRLIITDKLSAAIGKIAINNPEKISYAITINNYYGDLTDYEYWLNIYREPLSRLAAWLSKNKKEAGYEYPATNNRTIPAANSRAD